MAYVDGFVLPVPRKNLAAYRKMATRAGKVWREHGALDYKECIADDVKKGKSTSFPQAVKLKPGEVVWFSWILYKNQAPRQREQEGDEGQAHRAHDGPQENAVRWQALLLGRLQGRGRPVKPFEISRLYDATRQKVWQAWTEPERLKHWWGPRGFTVHTCKVDLRPGGIFL